MPSLLRLPHLLGRSNSNRSSSSGMSRRSSSSGNILEEQGYVQFHDDNSISSVDLAPVTYTVRIPSPSCGRKGIFYVNDEHRKLKIPVKRPENASPGEVIQVTAYLPANTTSNSGRFLTATSVTAVACSSGSSTAAGVSSVGPSPDDGEGEEEQTDSLLNNEHEILAGPSPSGGPWKNNTHVENNSFMMDASSSPTWKNNNMKKKKSIVSEKAQLFRIKQGLCPTCGVQTHHRQEEIIRWAIGIRRRKVVLIPLTNNDSHVEDGRCLACFSSMIHRAALAVPTVEPRRRRQHQQQQQTDDNKSLFRITKVATTAQPGDLDSISTSSSSRNRGSHSLSSSSSSSSGSSGSGHSRLLSDSLTATSSSNDFSEVDDDKAANGDDGMIFPPDLPRVLPVGDEHFICDDETQQNLFDSLLDAIRFQLPVEIIKEFTHVLHNETRFDENDCAESHTGETRGSFAARLLSEAFQHPSSLDVVKLLVELKRDTFMMKEEEWSDAFQLATPEVFEFLLRNYHVPSLRRLTDDSSDTLLHEMFAPDKMLDISSALSRKLQMVIERYPQALKTTNSTGQTPLHLTILKKESCEVVRLLVEKCPEAIKIQDNLNRDTVKHSAVASNVSEGTMRLLFEKCPESIETKNLNGETPLELAISIEKPSWVINLLKKEHEILSGRRIMRKIVDDAELGPEELPLGYLEYCTVNFSSDKLLGEGTFGQVYEAEDKAIKGRFAVKKLRVQRNSETSIKEARDSFIHEIETLKHFRHRNICRLYGYFLSDDLLGEQCLAFELAGKGSLRDCLAQFSNRGALHWTTRVKIAWEVAKAVEYMHTGKAGHTCFHRDIKSSNIYLKRNDETVVIDCGIARLLPHDDSQAPLTFMDTGENAMRGTPGYICPEYAHTRTNFGAACDIFSLGIVFVEIFTGILQGSMVSGDVVDLFNRYRNLNMEIRDLIQDADQSAGEWGARVKERFALLALECISWSPIERPDIKDIVHRLKNMAAIARPFSPGERNSITVLYSDPLVWRSYQGGASQDGESRIHAINDPTPNFERERQELFQSISESGRNIELSFDVATTCRFRKAISRRCGCLHFSGHGKDGYLFFEDGRGGAHFLPPDEVQELVSELPFKLVFVSACHSKQIGEAFVHGGVPHVICCDHEAELQDEAALSFTKIFYRALALGYTVNYAFRNGKGEVSGRFELSEAEKFLLLPENGDHDDQIFDAEELAEEIELHSSRNQFIPELPEPFLGRKCDAYKLLQNILDNRIVKLVGDNGVGCSSLAKYVCRYIEERETIFLDIQSIYYLQGGNAVDTCIRQLYEQLAAEGKVEEVSVGDELSRDVLLNNILNALRGAKALIVFDDAYDENLIEFLIMRITNVKILQVTASLMEVSPHSMEEIFRLGPLDFESSVELFGKHCHHSTNFEALFYKKLNHSSNYLTTDIRSRVYQTLEWGIPSQIIGVARGISQEDFQSLFFDP